MRLFHRHKWVVVGREHYSWTRGPRTTLFKLQCAKCRKRKTEEMEGTW